mgnify:CR=1 FL=1
MSRKTEKTVSTPPISRRQFVQSATVTAVLAASPLAVRNATASELPRVSEDDPTAKALNYVHDAGTVDAAMRPSDRYCNNCALYAGTPDEEWAGCSIFPGKAVAGKGWCSVWAQKQGS